MRKIALWAVVATKLPSCKSDTFMAASPTKREPRCSAAYAVSVSPCHRHSRKHGDLSPNVRCWPLAPDHVLMANGRYRSRSGHVGVSA